MIFEALHWPRSLRSDYAVLCAVSGVAIPLHSSACPFSLKDASTGPSLLADTEGLAIIVIPLFSTWPHLLAIGAATP